GAGEHVRGGAVLDLRPQLLRAGEIEDHLGPRVRSLELLAELRKSLAQRGGREHHHFLGRLGPRGEREGEDEPEEAEETRAHGRRLSLEGGQESMSLGADTLSTVLYFSVSSATTWPDSRVSYPPRLASSRRKARPSSVSMILPTRRSALHSLGKTRSNRS